MSPTFTFNLFYAFIKLIYLYSIVKIFLKFDNMRENITFLTIFYTVGLAGLSWVFVIAPSLPDAPYRAWEIWLAKSFVLTYVYFRLLDRFDEGLPFVILLAAGLGLVYF